MKVSVMGRVYDIEPEPEEIKKPTIIEIDPHGKYVLETPYLLNDATAEAIKTAFEEFIHDRKQHMFILHAGLILKKVEE